MHVLETPSGAFTVVCHFSIPATLNSAGVGWRDAYARWHTATYGVAPITKLASGNGQGGTITNPESNDVAGGVVAEVRETFTPPSDWNSLNEAQKSAALDAFYADRKAGFDLMREDLLREFGRTR